MSVQEIGRTAPHECEAHAWQLSVPPIGRKLARLPEPSHHVCAHENYAFESNKCYFVVFFAKSVFGYACNQATELRLPSNIQALTLPDIQLAEKYPTVGPEGNALANVNGRAAGIELYLSQECLNHASGNLRPVRWTGYFSQMNTYQGEVEGKAQIHDNFFKRMSQFTEPSAAKRAFPELVQVWQAIFKTVEESMSEARRNEALDFATALFTASFFHLS